MKNKDTTGGNKIMVAGSKNFNFNRSFLSMALE